MKQKIRLHIPEPCHENWDGMTVTQQGRFCNACSKEVVDFSLMTDKEIFDYISTAGIALCGRVGTGQLDRDLRSPAELRKTGWRYWTGLAA
ncbi:MAG: hypothetical protein ABI813_07735, partial [Bacteroidota bacterium]